MHELHLKQLVPVDTLHQMNRQMIAMRDLVNALSTVAWNHETKCYCGKRNGGQHDINCIRLDKLIKRFKERGFGAGDE